MVSPELFNKGRNQFTESFVLSDKKAFNYEEVELHVVATPTQTQQHGV